MLFLNSLPLLFKFFAFFCNNCTAIYKSIQIIYTQNQHLHLFWQSNVFFWGWYHSWRVGCLRLFLLNPIKSVVHLMWHFHLPQKFWKKPLFLKIKLKISVSLFNKSNKRNHVCLLAVQKDQRTACKPFSFQITVSHSLQSNTTTDSRNK